MNKKTSSHISKTIIYSFLEKLGLSEEEAKLYITLTERGGALTILELSRASGINRTRIYRLLEKLESLGIIEEIIDVRHKLAKAVGADTLELLVKDQESKVKYLREVFPSITNFISAGKTLSQPGTKVLFYRGKEGVRQQVWNTLRTKGEAVGYTYGPVIELIGEYYNEWRNEWIKRKLFFRDIVNPDFGFPKGITHTLNDPENSFATRIIPSNVLFINHQIDIYNEVVSYYNWNEGEVFGVEIYNEKIAQMQKQLFEMVWKMANK